MRNCLYLVHTEKPTPPALCLRTSVPRQKTNQRKSCLDWPDRFLQPWPAIWCTPLYTCPYKSTAKVWNSEQANSS